MLTNLSVCLFFKQFLFYSRLYTSRVLAEFLWRNKMTILGTIKNNRRGIPSEFKEGAGRPEGDYMVAYDCDSAMSLHSFLDKKKKGTCVAHPGCRVSDPFRRILCCQKVFFYHCSVKGLSWGGGGIPRDNCRHLGGGGGWILWYFKTATFLYPLSCFRSDSRLILNADSNKRSGRCLWSCSLAFFHSWINFFWRNLFYPRQAEQRPAPHNSSARDGPNHWRRKGQARHLQIVWFHYGYV
jgi:hypothetical protein